MSNNRLSLPWNQPKQGDALQTKQAMILMAHADDETLGCGGTMARLVDGGWDVRVVLLTDGILTTREGTIDDNRSAAQEACRRLGVAPPELLGYTDQKFDTFAIADMVNRVFQTGLDPDLIITHSRHDLNLDHRITFDVAMIVGRPRKKPISILSAEIPKNNFWNGETFGANFFVDISETIDRKQHAFQAYSNEVMEYPGAFSVGAIELLARYHGFHAGVGLAEGFELVRGYPGQLPS